MTMLDIMPKPTIVGQRVGVLPERADEGHEVRAAHAADEQPATLLNTDIMEKYRPRMRKYYYDPTKYKTYLEQLGIKYPTLRKSKERCEDTPTVP